MSHIDEDRLLAYALEILDRDSERDEVGAHLAGCAECRMRLEGVRRDVETIGSARPYGHALRISNPKARGRRVYAVIKAAAMIVLGVVVGLGASRLVHHPSAEVVPQYMVLSPPDDRSPGGAVGDVTELPQMYYHDLLGERQ